MTKILLIDDDESILEDIAEILENEDYNVIMAQNGSEGIKKAESFQPDLIISDIMMPVMNGYEVLEKLRSRISTYATPFIFLTSKSGKENLRHGMELGAEDYITKPINKNDVLNSVKSQLNKFGNIKKFYEDKLDELRLNISNTLPHELRTPLSAILGLSQILKSNFDELNKEEIKIMSGNIYQAGQRLLKIFNNYIYYSTLINLSSINFYDPCEITQFTDEIVNETAISISQKYNRSKDISLQIVNISINIKQDHFKKIFEELIDNAIRYSPKDTPVKVSTHVDNKMYYTDVSNVGRGINPEQISKIGAFMQFDRGEYEQQGIGFGLAIVKKIVELYRGSFSIDSVPEKRTSVSISLPL